MKPRISKTEAIRIARQCCSILGSGTSWAVVGPYHDSDPDGASTEVRACSYWAARDIRTRWRASIALHAMYGGADAPWLIDSVDETTLPGIVDAVAKRMAAREAATLGQKERA